MKLTRYLRMHVNYEVQCQDSVTIGCKMEYTFKLIEMGDVFLND